MLKTLLLVSLLLPLGLSALAQQSQPSPKAPPVGPYVIPVDAVRHANPVKKWYGYDCAMCHGTDGDGKGGVAKDMSLKVSDFTNPATLKDRTDGELFYVIKTGKGDMPPEGSRMKPDGLWDLVNYVRSLAKKDTPTPDKAPQ